MAIITGDQYLARLVRFTDLHNPQLLDGTLTLKLNPIGLHYVQSRLESLREIETLLAVAPVDYLRCYVSDLGDHRALEQLRRILKHLTNLKVVSGLEKGRRDPAPVSLLPFGRLRVLELRGCDLSTTEAKGLLELRHTLEKLICHNSTDALRHVFASRIVEINDSPNWNKLTFVSCACNNLVLMDESLQLLPAVETLDLSRNRLTKVDNLKKCVKLKHLDLGFNQLRSISNLSEVSSRIVKLNLRNNALATIRGIEYLKSLQSLDISCNILSSFAELETLTSLTQLESVWMEGNPVCCARWYRAHVFSFFAEPEKLKLDGKSITTREHWERHVIFAKRQKKPAGYGFYFPAKEESDDPSQTNIRKRSLRVVSIQEDQQHLISDEESTDQELITETDASWRKDENAPAVISDSESKVIDLINKAENLKKERSVLWLKEFKEWMDQNENKIHNSKEKVKENINNLSNLKGKLVGESSTVSERSVGSDTSFNDETHNNSNNNNGNSLRIEINGGFESKSFFDGLKLPPQYKEEVLQKRLFSDEILELSDDSSDFCDTSSDEEILRDLYASSSDDELAVQNGHLKRIISISEDLSLITEFDRGCCGNKDWEEENKEKILGFFEKSGEFEEFEICQDLIFCECVFQCEADLVQRKVALLQSSMNKLYIILIEQVTLNSQESLPKILASYKLEDLKKVIIGLGLQAFRLQMADEKVYIFLIKTMEKAHELLSLLKISTIPSLNPNLSLESWEQTQVKLLAKEIRCELKSGILFYAPLLFSKDKSHGGTWEKRSIFLMDGFVIICTEDFTQFGSSVNEVTSSVDEMTSSSTSRPYFSLDSCCSIKDILQVVVDLRQNKCMTLVTENNRENQISNQNNETEKNEEINEFVQIQKWRLQWFSQDALLKLVSLVKAWHWEITDSPLRVNCTN